MGFPYGVPPEDAQRARQAAVALLWDKRSMLPEHSEEIVDDVLAAAVPFLLPSYVEQPHEAWPIIEHEGEREPDVPPALRGTEAQ